MADPNPTPKPTEAEVRAMKAGPELDAMVAQSLGWRHRLQFPRWLPPSGWPQYWAVSSLPKFSSDPSACAEVKRRLFEMGWRIEVEWSQLPGYREVRVSASRRTEVIKLCSEAPDDPAAVECELLAKCACLAALAGKESGT